MEKRLNYSGQSLCNDSFQRKTIFIFYFSCTANSLCIRVKHTVNVNRPVCILLQNVKRRKRKKVKNKFEKPSFKVQGCFKSETSFEKEALQCSIKNVWHQQWQWWEKEKLRNPLSSWPQVNDKADMPNLFWQSALRSCMKKKLWDAAMYNSLCEQMKEQHFYTSVKLGLGNREPKTHLDTCGVFKTHHQDLQIDPVPGGLQHWDRSTEMYDDQLLCMLKISVVTLLYKFLFCERRAEWNLQAGNYSNPDKMSRKHELTFQYLYVTMLSNLLNFQVDNKSFVPLERTWSPKRNPQLKFTSTFCTDEDQAVFMCGTVKGQIFRHSVNSIIKHSGLIFFMFKAILGHSELDFIGNGDQMLLLSLEQNNVLFPIAVQAFYFYSSYLPLDLLILFCLWCLIRDIVV